MAYYKKRRKRLSYSEYLKGKVKRARKSERKEYWLEKLVAFMMRRGKKQPRRSWSFNKRRY